MGIKVALRRPKKDSGGSGTGIELIPDGKYRVLVDSLEETGDQWSSLKMNVKFEGGENAGEERSFLIFPNSEAIRSLVEVTGGDADAVDADLDVDAVVGTSLNVYLGNRQSKKDKKYYNTIQRFAPVGKAK